VAKALGIGGIFFKSPDAARLRDWYARWLGIPADEYGAAFMPAAMPAEARTVWSPFAADTTYFAPSSSPFMINFVVDDLDGALAQVREGGAQVVGSEDYDYGRFGWFVDPDGHKVELWQPKPAADANAEADR
jgi:predicted enzyme related to lactoylglutathione lyase